MNLACIYMDRKQIVTMYVLFMKLTNNNTTKTLHKQTCNWPRPGFPDSELISVVVLDCPLKPCTLPSDMGQGLDG